MKDADQSVKKPAILFVFGGAFVTGQERRHDFANTYFNTLTANDDGHFYFPTGSASGVFSMFPKFNIKPLKNAVDMAVADVYDATNWVIKHALIAWVFDHIKDYSIRIKLRCALQHFRPSSDERKKPRLCGGVYIARGDFNMRDL